MASTTPRTATADDLAELIRPFVGAKLNPPRDPASKYGAYLPQAEAIDIRATTFAADADVRSVGPAGVEIFFYKGCDLVPWDAIKSVTIRSLDADGNATAETTFEHVGERRAAA